MRTTQELMDDARTHLNDHLGLHVDDIGGMEDTKVALTALKTRIESHLRAVENDITHALGRAINRKEG